jgi:hypothetical protein
MVKSIFVIHIPKRNIIFRFPKARAGKRAPAGEFKVGLSQMAQYSSHRMMAPGQEQQGK